MEHSNSLENEYCTVGIRPTIDGRMRGVRESLEEKTMQMAKKTAEFISKNLKYPNGKPVQCVIANTTIGGVAEALDAQKKFQAHSVGLTLTVTPCWCYGTETIDMDSRKPHAIWGFNGTQRPGAVYLAAAMAGLAQKGISAFSIYGQDVQDLEDSSIPKDVQEKILLFVKAGLAVANIKDAAYLSMGSVSMGIAGSIVKDDFFQEYLGMRNEFVDMSEFIRRIDENIYDELEYKKALKWVKDNCKEGKDNNSPQSQWSRKQLDSQWEFVVKMTLIARDLMVGNSVLKQKGFAEEANGHRAICAGFQGQRQWTDHFPNGDFMETILNSSFDWNGTRQPYILATENDSLNGVAMLFNYMLTNTPQIFSDVRTYWSPKAVKRVSNGYELEGKASNGIIHLINSGSTILEGTGQQTDEKGNPTIKPYWENTQKDIQNILSAVKFRPANSEYFRGGGFSTNFLTKGNMPVTMSRISWVKKLGPVLQIAQGWTVDLPEKVHSILDNRTDPTWPSTWFAPDLTDKGAFSSVYSVMDNWSANHGAISYGHIGSELITLASMLRIPVGMHNVSDSKIFRPKNWSLFGTQNLESADYRACNTFGPLYKC